MKPISDARTCRGGCKRLRERLKCFASERGKTGSEIVSPVLDKRKGGSIRVTIAPRKSRLSEVGFHRLLISSEN